MRLKCDENGTDIRVSENFVLACCPAVWRFYPLSQEVVNLIPEEVRVHELNGNRKGLVSFYRGQVKNQDVNSVCFCYPVNHEFLFAVPLETLQQYLPKHAQRYRFERN